MEAVLGPGWKDEVVECRPADLIEPEWDMRRKELDGMGLLKREEDVLTYALYPKVGLAFLKGEAKAEFTSDRLPLDKDHPATRAMVKSFFPELQDVYLEVEPPEARRVAGPAPIPTQFNVQVDGEAFEVVVEPIGGFMTVAGAGAAGASPSAAQSRNDLPGAQKTGMQGTILKVNVKVGDKVKKKQGIAVIEAMKMESDILCDFDGEVKQIFIKVGDTVKSGEVIMQIL